MTQENRWKDYGSRFMVVKAVCSEKGLLNVQANRILNQSCEDIPAGLPTVFPKDYVQWGKECDKRGVTLERLECIKWTLEPQNS